MRRDKYPNDLLRYQRELRGWSQQKVAELLGTNVETVSRWECGSSKPTPFFREKLCTLFEVSAEELGFMKKQDGLAYATEAASVMSKERCNGSAHSLAASRQEARALSGTSGPSLVVASSTEAATPLVPTVLIRVYQAIDRLPNETACGTPEGRSGAWLALSAHHLVPLLEEGWSVEEVFRSLPIILKVVQAMPKGTQKSSRRQFFEKLFAYGVVAVIGGIPLPSSEHLSIEERVRLHSALAESIAAGWKLFHTAGTAQVLAVGQAQLDLLQQVSSHLYPGAQPLFYSGVHRLIGASQYFQGRYDEAYREQEKAYIAALEGADTWNMAQSRGWQAYVLKARGHFADALQMADAALRLVSYQHDTESVRLRARLLAFSAENAALLGDGKEVQTRLDASEALLEHLPGYHEEFDRVSWLQQAGTCALSLQHYDVAVTRLQQAFDELPAQWTLRTVSTAIPLARALTQQKERSRALAIARKTLPLVKSSQSPTLVQEFTTYLQAGLLASFPNDSDCQKFVAEAQRRLAMVE